MASQTESPDSPNLLGAGGKKANAIEENWQKKIDKALAARRAGQELRKGKTPALSTTRRVKL